MKLLDFIITEGKLKITKPNEWLGKKIDDWDDLGSRKCSICGYPLGDEVELRPHHGEVVGYKGKDYHYECFAEQVEKSPIKNKKDMLTISEPDKFINITVEEFDNVYSYDARYSDEES